MAVNIQNTVFSAIADFMVSEPTLDEARALIAKRLEHTKSP